MTTPETATAIRLYQTGGPECLTVETGPLPTPKAGEVLLRQTAVGVNFIDTYHRTGLYPVPLPTGLGLEAVGVIEAVGPGVETLKPGDRVAYGIGPIGAYATARVMPIATLVKVPDGLEDTTVAGMMLRGLTVEYLTRRLFKVQPGMTVLFHAAAGGVGQIACQWLKHLGATVIGTVGSDEKAEIAKANGCHHPIVYTRENFVDRVKELTDGKGVDVVYDGVGQAVFLDSLDCLKLRGMMCTFGNASGPVPAIDPLLLSQKGGLFLTRPTLMHYNSTREELVDSSTALFEVVGAGAVHISIGQTFPLTEAAEAHRALESRKTTGSTILTI